MNNNDNTNCDTDTTDTNITDTDSDEYVDLSNCIKDDLKHIFQFHLTNEKLFVKYIGKSSDTPDIIIMENFGPESNMSLYNCVYSHNELEQTKNNDLILPIEQKKPFDNLKNKENVENINNLDDLGLFFPIIKLVVKNTNLQTDNYIISSIAIKLNQEIKYEEEIKEWELFWVENSSSNKEFFKTKKLEKNINPTNILENIVKLSLDK